MKRLFLLLTLVFSGLATFAQTAHPDYSDGQLYWRVKVDQPSVLPDSIISAFQVQAVEAPFQKLSKTELKGKKELDRLHRTFRIRFGDATAVDAFIAQLYSLPETELVEKVPLVSQFYTPNDPQLGSQYNLAVINAPLAWDISLGNPNVSVAVVDDAVLTTHQDLAPAIWVNPGEIPGNGIDDDGNGYIDDVSGYDVADNDPNPNPPFLSNSVFTHGTHCAGIAGASTDDGTGIASIGFGIKIIPVKCNNDATPGPSLPAAYDGLTYAISVLPEVISLSWGGPGQSATNQLLIDVAYANDIVVVAAAGNNNSSIPMFPASYNHVISVAATDPGDVKASFSNFNPLVDVSAPGVNILSTLAGGNASYGNLSGTSMACPLVAGLCGLMRSHNPTMSVDQIDSCLQTTADNIDTQNPTFIGQLGAGRVNAQNALACVSGTPLANFTFDTDKPCPGLNVQFTDQSYGSPTSWNWEFPGGIPATSTLQNPLVNYPVPGIYPCTLIVSNALGIDTMIHNSVTVALPTATISGGGIINPGSPAFIDVNFTGDPPYSFVYTDGSTNFPVTGVFSNPYIFTVTPAISTTYTLVSMSNNQCSGTVSGSAPVTVSAGCAAAFDFQDILGGPLRDEPYAVKQTPDCGYILAGHTYSFGASTFNAFLAKYDQNGGFQWFRTYNPSGDNSSFYDVIPVSNGYVAAGTRRGVNDTRLYLVKVDLSGTIIWRQTVQYISGGGAIGAYGWELVEMPNGDLAVSGAGRHPNFNDYGQLLARFNGINGNVIWERNAQVNDYEASYGLTTTSDLGVVAAGRSQSSGVTAGNYDMALTKRSGTGALVWSKNYGASMSEIAYDVVRLPDEGFIMVGSTESFSASVSDILAIRTDSLGNLIWARTYARSAADNAYKIVPGCNGKYFIGGYSRSSTNGNDALLFQIDTLGNVLWSRTIGGVLDDGDRIALGATGDCGCVATLSTLSYGVGDMDLLLLKTDSLGNASCHTDTVVLNVSTVTPSVFNSNPNYLHTTYSTPSIVQSVQSHLPSRPDSVCDACGFPEANFDYVTNVLSLTTFDESVNGRNWRWDFGDGTAIDTMVNAVHAYPGPGTYTVTLIVSSPCGSDTISKSVTISGLSECLHVYQPGPTKGIDARVLSFPAARGTNYGGVNFINGAAWTWSGTRVDQRNYQYFDLSRICNSANLLDARYSAFFEPSILQVHSGSNGSTMQRCTSPWEEYAITWLNQPATTTVNSITLPTTAGTADLINLNVTPLFSDLIVGPNYGFLWRLSSESIYKRFTYLSSDYTVPDQRPRLELRFDPIHAHATIQATGQKDTTICIGDSIQLNLAGYLNASTTSGPSVATRYLWIPSAGLDCDTCASPMASPDTTTTYRAIAFNCPSCGDIDTVRVVVSRAQVQALDNVLCIGDSVQMTALHPIPGTQFTWVPAASTFPANVQNPMVFPTVPTWYHVTAVDTINSCVSSD